MLNESCSMCGAKEAGGHASWCSGRFPNHCSWYSRRYAEEVYLNVSNATIKPPRLVLSRDLQDYMTMWSFPADPPDLSDLIDIYREGAAAVSGYRRASP